MCLGFRVGQPNMPRQRQPAPRRLPRSPVPKRLGPKPSSPPLVPARAFRIDRCGGMSRKCVEMCGYQSSTLGPPLLLIQVHLGTLQSSQVKLHSIGTSGVKPVCAVVSHVVVSHLSPPFTTLSPTRPTTVSATSTVTTTTTSTVTTTGLSLRVQGLGSMQRS